MTPGARAEQVMTIEEAETKLNDELYRIPAGIRIEGVASDATGALATPAAQTMLALLAGALNTRLAHKTALALPLFMFVQRCSGEEGEEEGVDRYLTGIQEHVLPIEYRIANIERSETAKLKVASDHRQSERCISFPVAGA